MRGALFFKNMYTLLLLEGKDQDCKRILLCILGNIMRQYFFYSFDFAIVALTERDFTVGAGANTNIGCDTLRSFGMHCSMTIVNGLRYF